MEIKTPNVPAAKEPAAMTKKKAATAKDYLVSASCPSSSTRTASSAPPSVNFA